MLVTIKKLYFYERKPSLSVEKKSCTEGGLFDGNVLEVVTLACLQSFVQKEISHVSCFPGQGIQSQEWKKNCICRCVKFLSIWSNKIRRNKSRQMDEWIYPEALVVCFLDKAFIIKIKKRVSQDCHKEYICKTFTAFGLVDKKKI